jgi:type I site-specific restriction endonuclease
MIQKLKDGRYRDSKTGKVLKDEGIDTARALDEIKNMSASLEGISRNVNSEEWRDLNNIAVFKKSYNDIKSTLSQMKSTVATTGEDKEKTKKLSSLGSRLQGYVNNMASATQKMSYDVDMVVSRACSDIDDKSRLFTNQSSSVFR